MISFLSNDSLFNSCIRLFKKTSSEYEDKIITNFSLFCNSGNKFLAQVLTFADNKRDLGSPPSSCFPFDRKEAKNND